MRYYFVRRFVADFDELPSIIQKKFYKQLKFLLKDLRHPSLHAKKYNESDGIWQARVDRNYRFYFKLDADRYILLMIKAHKD